MVAFGNPLPAARPATRDVTHGPPQYSITVHDLSNGYIIYRYAEYDDGSVENWGEIRWQQRGGLTSVTIPPGTRIVETKTVPTAPKKAGHKAWQSTYPEGRHP